MTTTIDAPRSPRSQDLHSEQRDGLDTAPLDKPMIAELSNDAIDAMTSEELRHLIRASEHPWRGNRLDRRLQFCDRDTLIRLAYLARRCCRNQGY